MNRFVYTLCIVLFAYSAICRIGDRFPFCLWPQTFPTSLEVTSQFVDWERFSGVWYEVARSAQAMAGNSRCVQTNYIWHSDERYVEVQNSYLTPSGSQKSMDGNAWPRNENQSELFIRFYWYASGQYWVLDLDPDYQWAIIGEPCKRNWFFISRTQSVSQELLQQKVYEFSLKGFNLANLNRREAQDC